MSMFLSCDQSAEHEDNKQILWKCDAVQIFGNDSNKQILIQEAFNRDLIMVVLATYSELRARDWNSHRTRRADRNRAHTHKKGAA
jgi:hypothetical protein